MLLTKQGIGIKRMDEIEPELSDDGLKPATSLASSRPKGRRSLSHVSLELTEGELKNSGVQKLVLDDLYRQIEENEGLRGFQGKFYEADKRAEVLSEKLNKSRALDIMYSGLLTVGAALAGYGATAGPEQSSNPMLIGLGSILIVAALIARAIIR